MEILGHTSTQLVLFLVLFGVTGVVPLIAALYLLLRRANAIAPSVTSPVRLRRWTAAFFGVSTLAHAWWLLFYILSGGQNSLGYLALAMLDCVLLFTTFAGMLLSMLQDRRRSVWPAVAAMTPFVLLMGAYMVFPSSQLIMFAVAYLVLVGVAFTGYMVFAIRQYERWLNDNYADLENKKVWLSQMLALSCMLQFVLYVFATDIVILWLVHIIELVLTVLLLWRAETLPTLELPVQSLAQQPKAAPVTIDINQIEQELKENCVATHLYLQHDLTLSMLAQVLGTNRTYLSLYFSRKNTTYNAYINMLRIQHFERLYREAVVAGRIFTAQQLAQESGYRSYSTFSLAFKQRMGQSAKDWMNAEGGLR